MLKKSPLLVVVLVLSLLISIPAFAGDYVAKLNIPISSYFARVLLTTLFDLKLVALFGRRARGLALQI